MITPADAPKGANITSDELAALAPCPFCGCAMSLSSNRDWHRIDGPHDDQCPLIEGDPLLMVPAKDTEKAWAITAWNRRASLKGEAAPPPQQASTETVAALEYTRGRIDGWEAATQPQQAGGNALWRGIDKMLVAAYEHGLNSEPMDMIAMKARYAELSTPPQPEAGGGGSWKRALYEWAAENGMMAHADNIVRRIAALSTTPASGGEHGN